MGLRSWFRGMRTRWALLGSPAGGVVAPFGEQAGRIYDGLGYIPPIPEPAYVREDAEAHRNFVEAIADEFKHQFGSPFPRGGPFKMPPIVDPLTEWTASTRRYILEQCHLYQERNPIVAAAAFYTRVFSVQGGASITYQNKDVEKVCEAFIKHPENAIRALEKGVVDALFVDGEVFLRYFKGGETPEGEPSLEGTPGELVVVPLVPWGVIGIKHQPGFWKRIVHYRYQVMQDTGDDQAAEPEYVNEEIPARDVQHIAINRHIYERRGRPEAFKMLPWARAYHEWLENRARQNFWRGAILFWVKLLMATPAQVLAKLAAYKKPPQPGSLVVSNDKEEWTQFAPNVGASDAGEDGRQLRAMAATGARLPESWLSDGADANLATAKAQALPAIRSFGEWQDLMRDEFWTPMLRRVIQAALDAGLLTEEVPVQDADGEAVEKQKKVKALEAFSVTYPELEADAPKDAVTAVTMALSADLISTQTARGLLPWTIDSAKEQKQIDAERQKEMDDMAKGLIPMPPFGGIQQPGQPPTNGKEPADGKDERDGDERDERTQPRDKQPVPAAA
jgi:hypothetical protein